MSADERVRLHLVGDDPALDVLAELGRHLPTSELSRSDELPGRALDRQDVVVIGALHARTRESLLRGAMEGGGALHVVVLAPSVYAEDEGGRAILAAAELVRLLVPGLGARASS